MKNETLTNEERENYLEIVHRSMRRLTELVGRLFEYSRFEANQVKVEKEAFWIDELASDVIANYMGRAEERNIRLSLESDEEITPGVCRYKLGRSCFPKPDGQRIGLYTGWR